MLAGQVKSNGIRLIARKVTNWEACIGKTNTVEVGLELVLDNSVFNT